MDSKGKWIRTSAVVATIVLGLGVGFWIWDRNFYPLPGTYDYPRLEWPRPFIRLAQSSHEFAEKLREKKQEKQYRQWIGLDNLAGTVWEFTTDNQYYFDDERNLKNHTSGKIHFEKNDRVRISGEPFVFPWEIENKDFNRYQFHRSNPDELIFYADTEELRLELGKVLSRVPKFAGRNSDFRLDVIFTKIVTSKP